MIESKDNKIIKLIRSLHSKKHRKEQGFFILEGKKFVLNQLELDKNQIEYIIITPDFKELFSEEEGTIIVSEEVFSSISTTKSPQGIMAVCKYPKVGEIDFKKVDNILFLDKVRDPENVGALIRSSVCADFNLVVLSKECADPYSPKSIRASSGSIINTVILENVEYNFLSKLKDLSFNIIGSTLSGNEDVTFPRKKNLLIVGNEGSGISEEALSYCNILVKIPMSGRCESLNANVSGGILMYKIIGY